MSEPFGSKRSASAVPLQSLNDSPSRETVTPSQSAESHDVEKFMQRPQRFSLPDISLNREADHATPTHQFGEEDYESHRQTNLHVHHPLSQIPRKATARSKSASKLGIPGSSSKTSVKSAHSGVGIDDSIGVIHEDDENEEDSKRDIPKFTIGDPDIDDENPEIDEKDSGETAPMIPTIVIENEDDGPSDGMESKERKHHHKHHHRDRDQKHHHRHHHHHHHKHHHGHHHGHHHHHKQYMDPLDLTLRSQQGSHVELGKLAHSEDTLPTEEEEAKMLNPADLDEMTTHRFGEVPGMSRSKVKRSLSSFIHVSSKAGSDRGSVSEVEALTPTKYQKKKKKKSVVMRKEYDHRPHEVFVELDELFKEEGHEMQWKEKARWIKFEEDVEEGAHKWGKPHVASLSFHSLVELRHFLEEASCLLDLEEKDLPEIFNRIVDQMIISDQARDEERGQILRTLLLKHKHLQDRPGLLKNISTVSLGSLLRTSHSEANLRHHKDKNISAEYSRNESSISLHSNEKLSLRRLATEPVALNGRKSQEEVHIPMLSPEIENISNSNDAMEVTFHPGTSFGHTSRLEPRKLDEQRVEGIMKKIPLDAEATTVLVGELDALKQPAVVFVRLAEGTRLASLTEVPIPVRFLFIMLGPGDIGVDYHEIGRSFSTLMSNEHFHEVAYKADSMYDLLRAMNEFIDHTIVLPPGNWDKELLLPVLRMQNEKMMEKRRLMEKLTIPEEDEWDETDEGVSKAPDHPKDIDPLRRTGRLFGGMFDDIKRRYPKYLSDIKDGLNFQCLAAFFFIYFACLSPAITFGGLLGEKSDNWMGVTEMILGSSIAGVVFSLFSAQPLTIIGATGPVIIFEENLYQFCIGAGIEFLPYRAWVSIWLFIIITVTVAFEGSTLVRYFTRFTEEIFAFLISLIFIFEVFNKLSKIFQEHPLVEDYCIVYEYEDLENSTELNYYSPTMYSPNGSTNITDKVCSSSKEDIKNQPNTALLSTVLTLGTFLLAYFLRIFRNGRFLGREARKMIGDFGIPISIFAMCLLDILIKDVYTQKLDVPIGLEPTDSCKRGWIVNPLGTRKEAMSVLLMFSAVIPALLIFILVYMETLITALILNKKELKLTKGPGFHIDLFILGVMACFNGIFGFPWVCSATVRSVTHVGALSVYSKSHAPGEKPRLEGIREQRVTAFLVNLMIGLSLALAPLLQKVPLAVLFGVFLYMGVSSLSGIQMVDRTKLIFMPTKHHPDVTYVRKVQTYRMHFFTVLQLTCLAILWVVKTSAAALAFPFFLILLVPVRMFLPKFFSKQELEALDGSEVAIDDDVEDEYTTTHMPI